MKTLILHLSDIHLHEHGNPSEDKFQFIGKALQNEVFDLGRAIVVLSGDVAYSGKSEEYDIATGCLSVLNEDLKERLKLEEIQFVFVPGNHDCDFSNSNSVREIVINGIRSGKVPDDEMIACCCSVQSGFSGFRDAFPTGAPQIQHSPIHWEYSVECSDHRLQFRCYNTAWMSQLNEKQGGLHMPDSVLYSSDWSSRNDYVISVFHHPYNWMPPASYRRFRSVIEESSDLILTGHEHEPDHYQKYSFAGEVNEYLEGSVFQEHGRDDRAGFHAVYIDLSNQKQRTVSFWWEVDKFIPAFHGDKWIRYKRGSRTGKRDFNLNESFADWLEDPGASYQHPIKEDITLSDIFVFPNLKKFTINDNNEFVYSSLVEGRDLLKTLGAKSNIFIFGRHQSGKTTLAKVLFKDFYNKNLTPVLIDGSDITKSHLSINKLERLVERNFQKQYMNPSLPSFKQLDKDKSVVIIDDFDRGRLNSTGRIKLLENICQRYDNIVVLGDDVLKVEELVSGQEAGEILNDFEQYEIVQFGHLLRNKIISQWYSLGSEYDVDTEQLERRIHQAEQLVNTMLGRSYLPSYPVFVLSLVQAQESVARPSSNAGTYGSLYELLITQSLAAKSSAANLDLKLTYLSELAYWMYQKRHKRISDEEWEEFHLQYCSKYKIQPSRVELMEELSDRGLFDFRDECYGFRHAASYYYFIARYLRDHLAKTEIKELVQNLLAKLNKEENVSIWLFLTHLSKDPFLIDEILKHSKRIFGDLPAATFDTDIEFLEELYDGVDQIVLKDKEFRELKEDRLRQLDDTQTHPAVIESDDSDDEETNEALRMISKLNLALRTLEVLGQLVKNFPGSLEGTEKHALVEECYDLGLRTVSMLFDAFQSDVDGFLDLVLDRVIERHPEIKDRDELKKRVRQFMFWMIEASSLGMVKRISQAVGHSQLGETYRDIREGADTNAYSLIDISIRLDNLGFPENDLTELSKRFRGNPFCDRILKQLAVQHFYMFPTKETTKQKVCSALKIELKDIHHIDVQSKNVRRIANPIDKKGVRKKVRDS